MKSVSMERMRQTKGGLRRRRGRVATGTYSGHGACGSPCWGSQPRSAKFVTEYLPAGVTRVSQR